MEALVLDYTNVFAEAVGVEHGITASELVAVEETAQRALGAVQARRTQDLRWLDLPHQDAIRDSILAYARSTAGRFRNIVVLGIGGSALGNRALHTALSPLDLGPDSPGGRPRLHVLDNIDPDWMGEFLERVDPSTCLFNVISKSGSTAETMAQFLIIRRELVKRLGEVRAREHVVVTTDAQKGVLRPIVEQEGYASFAVPDGVGGRFSVLSPVGLLSAAMIGIDIGELLAGAAAMDARCRESDFERNPAEVYAAIQWLMQTRKAKPISVTFAYSHRLRDLADWYAQLLAESLGKERARDGKRVHAGPTPVRAVGVTDQHSQVQLYAEGPFDKWFTFLAVEHSDRDVRIPADYADRDALAYLGGRTLGELFHAEREGTRIALTEAQRPNVTLRFPRIRAHAIGQYLQLMEIAVALMGELYGVDAFDQPGVEAGKIAAYALMGRAGYEARRAEIEQRLGGRVRAV